MVYPEEVANGTISDRVNHLAVLIESVRGLVSHATTLLDGPTPIAEGGWQHFEPNTPIAERLEVMVASAEEARRLGNRLVELIGTDPVVPE